MSALKFLVVFLAVALLPSAAVGQQGPQDSDLFQWNGQRWVQVDGYGTRVSVGPDGSPWVVNSRNEIYRFVNGGFQPLPGAAKDIGVGPDGSAWIIGTDDGVYRWNQSGWDRVVGSGVAISVDRSGAAWVVNGSGEIYRWLNGQFALQPGRARDIGAGHDVWIIGTDNTIYRFERDTWTPVRGSGDRISAGPAGTAWVVNSVGEVYRWQDGTFERLPGSAADIGVNAAGQAWMVGARAAARPRRR